MTRDTVTGRICEAIRGRIAAGLYGPGARLPSTRALAAEWGVSRTTVTAAYEQLLAEGYLETRQGARAQVASGLRPVAVAAERHLPVVPAARLSGYGRRVAALRSPPHPGPDRLIADFRYGDLAGADFPTLAWKRALNAGLLRRSERLRYGDPCGSPELRAALQGYLWRARGLRCEPDQIVVVSGSQQGLDLCARLLLDPCDRAVVEDPCYLLARQTFLAAGAALVPCEVDREGMRTDRLAGIEDARLAFVTPSHQSPTTVSLSLERRHHLLRHADAADVVLIEDDYESENLHEGTPMPALKSLDRSGHVIYVGSLSKSLSPAVRLGYIVAPQALVAVPGRQTPVALQQPEQFAALHGAETPPSAGMGRPAAS